MEIMIPHIVPDETVRKIFLQNLETLYSQLNEAHGQCLNDNPTKLFSDDLEEEKKTLEKALEGIDIIHGFFLKETVDSMRGN